MMKKRSSLRHRPLPNPFGGRLALLAALGMLATTAVPSQIQPSAPPRLSGHQLLQHFAGEPGVLVHEQKPEWLLKMSMADGYIGGVADTTEGTTWCNRGHVKSGEVNALVMDDLRKLPAADLAQPASRLIAKALGMRFPCKR